MNKKSAGIVMYRFIDRALEVLLVHPGGPFWAKKDLGAWTIPKGEFEDSEDALDAAKREVEEETGKKLEGQFIALTPVKQKSGKIVYAWAIKTDFETDDLKSNFFEIEWPSKSGRKTSFPEIDKAAWFAKETAKNKIIPAQLPLLEELELKVLQ